MWRCPRCGKWFSAKWWYNKGFLARQCVHCGLQKYQG
jgi:Zn ribbon nucleic-acid-binding protein